MNDQLTNAHIHIFVSECAPPGFLKVNPFKGLKFIAGPIKSMLEGNATRKIIWKLNKKVPFLSRYRRIRLDRVVSFLNVGAQQSQADVFEISRRTAESNSTHRLIVHTLDMDYMDTNSTPLMPYATQLYNVLRVKKDYPDKIFPFVSSDPRSLAGKFLVTWIKYYFNHGVESKAEKKIIPYCSGIKIYPAHGFFPFDTRLDELYKYAEENHIPIMFHCTREGSQYIGNEIESLIPHKPEMIMPPINKPEGLKKAQMAQQDIYTRISRYYEKDGWIKNSSIGENEYACDLFSHPQNYIPIMCKYPNLKICLAHMGGASEVEYMYTTNLQATKAKKKLKEIWATDGHNWASLIKEMMKEYHNFYTDISSTITHLDDAPVLQNIGLWLNENDNKDKPLGNRILFGTDFFMTELQHSETELYGFIKNKLGDWFEKMAGENIDNYLN